jgi:hypothetical protein
MRHANIHTTIPILAIVTMDQQDSLPSRFIYELIALIKSYHMLVRYRKKFDVKWGGSIILYRPFCFV